MNILNRRMGLLWACCVALALQGCASVPHADARDQLLAGQIDAMAIVDGFDSPTIQGLIAHPELHIFDFAYADAYVKRMPYLEVVTIPRGSLDLAKLDPPNDIHMIASTVTLLVEKTMHPAIQQLFLQAADRTNEDAEGFFGRADQFPAYIDKSIPLSDVAQRYYDKGAPWLTGLFAAVCAWNAVQIYKLKAS